MQNQTVKVFWNELWKKVDFGKPTKNCDYHISNFGRIKSVDKLTNRERLLKGAKARGGLIMLNQKLKDNSTGIVYIHRFVAENFLDKPSADQEYILHIDYDKSNNMVNNLRWATEEEWKEYQKKNPHHKGRPARTKNYKLTETQVRLMKKMLLRGKTKRKIIARKFGVSENCAYKIEKGIRWAHIEVNVEEEDD
ncbi:MAG: HNH endonuclease [Lewinellaceae bacterium]|nr:HNH endonuclease [Phaeodactylibacter sp.]MCB0613822.1 HNH endonuclease [Phaeodactylibacter sp.]MCB9346274.1 HNH endonuclease [Lewinellaceae bacterium]